MLRIEYFINGHHQPELSFYGVPDSEEQLPPNIGYTISPFLQSYKYLVKDIVMETRDNTIVLQKIHEELDGREKAILVCLVPNCEFSKQVFEDQYKGLHGDFSFPVSPIPVSLKQMKDHERNKMQKKYGGHIK